MVQVIAVISLQEGCGFKPAGQLGPSGGVCVADCADFPVVLFLVSLLISGRSVGRTYIQAGDGHLSVPLLFSPGPEATQLVWES